MSEFNLSGSFIQDTYQRLVQIGSGSLLDGTGSALPISISGNDVSLTSSLDVAQNITASGANITNLSSTDITATGTVSASIITTPSLKVTGSAEFSGSLQFNSIAFTETAIATHAGSHVWGTNTQSAHYFSGSITASNNIVATNFYGDGSGLTNITTSAISGTPNISVTDISASDITASNVSASGAISSSTLTSQGQASVGSLMVGSSSIDPSGAVKNMVLKFNGTHFVPQVYNYDFQFSISTFTYTTTTQRIGTGSWKDPGEFEFEATYQNPDISSATIEEYDEGLGVISTFTSNFTNPSNSVAINYPSTVEGLRFRISASGETKNGSTINFYNDAYYGADAIPGAYNQTFIKSQSIIEKNNSYSHTDKSMTGATNNFVFYAQRAVLNDPNSTVSGNKKEFLIGTSNTNEVVAPFTKVASAVSLQNQAGFTENYEIFKSDVTMSTNLVYLSTGKTIKNYTYYGAVDAWNNSTITEADIEGLSRTISETVASSLSITVANKYVVIAYPYREGTKTFPITAPAEMAAGGNLSVGTPVTRSVTNQWGYEEKYYVYRSSQKLDPEGDSGENLQFNIQ